MLYRIKVRSVKSNDGWVESEGEDFADALQNWHIESTWASDIKYDQLPRNEGTEIHYFLVAWDTDGERWISRVVSSPIRRKGGVRIKTKYPTLSELAVKVGLPEDALDGPWEGESDKWQ